MPICPQYPNNVVIAYKILIKAPITVVYAEKSFSKLKIINNLFVILHVLE